MMTIHGVCTLGIRSQISFLFLSRHRNKQPDFELSARCMLGSSQRMGTLLIGLTLLLVSSMES